MSQEDFVHVATAETLPVAEAAVARLREAGIDARLPDIPATEQTEGIEGTEVPSEAFVMVPADQVVAAMDLLLDIASLQRSPEAVAAGLVRIRRRRRLMWFWFFSYLPAAVFVTVVGPESLVAPLTLGWLAAYLLAGALATRSRCPECGKWYCRNDQRWDPYSRACLNCGLPLEHS